MNQAMLAHLTDRVHEVQEMIGRPLVLENVSSYIRYRASDIPEWEFLAALAKATDCGILLDVNNVYVNAHNHGFDAKGYIDAMPREHVVQIHMAGHTDCGTHLLDTHKGPVPEDVWSLYRYTLQRIGLVSTLIEWDADVPAFDVLMAEAHRAQRVMDSVTQAQGSAA